MLCITMTLFVSCKKEKSIPTLTTSGVTDVTTVSAICGGEITSDGGATVTERGICWGTSENPTIADSHATSGNGIGSFTVEMTELTPNTTFYVRSYATNSVGIGYGEQKSFTTLDPFGGHAYVDLGLPSGLLWATCNVGANSPEEFGDYFAWGEIQTKSNYDWITYKWCNGDYFSLTKYNTNSDFGIADDLTELELSDDAAYANWGAGWRMPTNEEMEELLNTCTAEWTTQNGVYGRLITGLNGNTIFFPATGYYEGNELWGNDNDGHYWSSSLDPVYTARAYNMGFFFGDIGIGNDHRCYGQPVRPVYSPHN